VADLKKWGPILYQEMKKLPQIKDVNTDQQNGGLQASLNYDRRTAARLGITPQLIDQSLYGAFGQAQVSTIYTSLNQYHVVMEAAPQYTQSPWGWNRFMSIPLVETAFLWKPSSERQTRLRHSRSTTTGFFPQ